MAFNSSIITSAIQTYVDQLGYNKFEREIVLQSRIAGLVQTLSGIKNAQTINVNTSMPVWQAQTCGLFNPTGSNTLMQRTLTVCPVEIEEDICYSGVNSLEQIWVGMNLPKGSYYDSGKILPETFAEVFVADLLDKIADGVEYVVFQGSQTGATFGSAAQYSFNNYAQYQPFCQGWLDILTNTSASQSVIFYSGTATGPLVVNQSNVVVNNSAFSVVDQLVVQQMQALPNLADRKDLYLFMSYANYRAYVASLRNLNFYHFNALENASDTEYSILHPGTNVRIQAVSGLIGSNYMILTYGQNLYIGYDAQDEQANMQVWYEPLYDATMVRPKWKFGTQIAYPQYTIIYTGK